MVRGPLERDDDTGKRRAGRVKARSFAGMSNKKFRAQSPIDSRKLGVDNSKLNEPHPNYNVAPCEKVIEGDNNQFIILGRDRPAGQTSGYGGAGDTHCARIELVAGMSGMEAKEVILKNQIKEGSQYDSPDDNEEMVYTDGNVFADAAKIYMSARTDVDRNFKLAISQLGNFSTRSAIALKADAVRIISRDAGIKLIAGGTDAINSQGKEVQPIKVGIALNAGNVPDSEMYKLVKGEKLVEYLKNLSETISQLNSAVGQIAQTLISVAAPAALNPFTAPLAPLLAAGGALATVTTTTHQVNSGIQDMDRELQSFLSQHNYTN